MFIPLNLMYAILTFVFLFSSIFFSKAQEITLIGVGDIMMGSNYPSEDLPPNDGSELMRQVCEVLQDADITFGNLEGVLLDQGGIPKKCNNPSTCYTFRTPTRFVKNLTDAGFDIMSLANNHAGDFGNTGRMSSAETLKAVGIEYAGQVDKPYTILKKNNITYGFAAFAPNSNCQSINNLAEAKKIICHLDSLSDIVIVSFHGGAEGPSQTHVPRKQEIFLGENRGNVYQFAHELIECGADVVFGHGPHVVRAVEVYCDRFIAYSLGNFCTYGKINVNGVNGIAPIIKVYTDKTGKFLKGQVFSARQFLREPIKWDTINKEALKEILRLTKTDFPECRIEIDENGWIRSSGN